MALCAGIAMPASAADQPGAADAPFAPRLSIEMAAHRRLIVVMDKAGHDPAPFVTDGCSGGLSMAWDVVASLFPSIADTHQDRPTWEACCVTHDRAYHDAGGTRTAGDSYRARVAADETLRACILKTGAGRAPHLSQTYGLTEAQIAGAYDLIAEAMFHAVRLGGGPCTGLPWRWGYGYPGCLLGK